MDPFRAAVHASRAASLTGRYWIVVPAAPPLPGTVSGVVVTGVGAGGPPRRAPVELSLHDRIEVAVEHRARVGRLVPRAQVLDHLVGLQHVRANLVPPARRDV